MKKGRIAAVAGLAAVAAIATDLADFVVNNSGELSSVVLGTGFRGITDIETGPDGHLYILSYSGNVYRIVPAQ